MAEEHRIDVTRAAPRWALSRVVAAAAVVAAALVGLLLGVRPLISQDLGYHLAYGERFWRSGEIVDHSPELYTLPPRNVPEARRPEPGPGCWYDEDGRYRFPNANWLTQVLLAGAYLVGGFPALNGLLMLSVWGLVALVLVLMRRLGAGPLAAAAGALLVFLVSYERFMLRPELFGYLALLGQAVLLAPFARDVRSRKLGWGTAAGLLVLQWLAANAHSYFLIGCALTAAVAVDAWVRRLWGDRAPEANDALRRNARRLALLVALQLAVCFLNPWTWRLVALPFQTTAYLSEHGITRGDPGHPWSWMRETRRTFLAWSEVKLAWRKLVEEGFSVGLTLPFLTIALAAALIGAPAALVRQRWGQLLWLAAGALLSLSMHRNVGVGAMLMVPVAAAAWHSAGSMLAQGRPRATRALTSLCGTALVAFSAFLAVVVITGRCYPPAYQARFGPGRSRVLFPEGPAEWLNRHRPQGRIWTEHMASSNLYFLLDPRPEFPVLTNTWAYPPAVMGEVYASWSKPGAFARVVSKYGLSALFVRIDDAAPVARRLFGNRRWYLVYLDGAHALFLRADGPDADLAEQERLTQETWDVRAFIERSKAEELRPAYAMFATANALAAMRWHDEAITVLREVTALEPDHAGAWFQLGGALANRALERRAAGDAGWVDQMRLAERALERRLGLRDDRRTHEALQKVREALRRTEEPGLE